MDDVYRMTVMKMGKNLILRLPSSLIQNLTLEDRDELRIVAEKTGNKIPKKRSVPESWKERSALLKGRVGSAAPHEKNEAELKTATGPVQNATDDEQLCSECKVKLTLAEADFSKRHFQGFYCRTHQEELKKMRGTA